MPALLSAPVNPAPTHSAFDAQQSLGGARLEEVSVHFKLPRRIVVALNDINLTISPGEFVALIGPSGCGKSTLLNVIAGFQPPTKGRVQVDGRTITEPGPDRAVVFQQHSLFPWMTVLQNVAFGPQMIGRHDASDVAQHYLRLVGLTRCAHQYPAQLSGGMRQRVGLARALAVEPSVLLMDEPFGALDAQTRSLMQEQLLEVWDRSRCTVVFVTHDIDEAIFLADRIAAMGVEPSGIRDIFDVDLERPRTVEIRRSEAYLQLQEQLFELIRTESLKSFRAETC